MIERLLIANRGDIVYRIARSCRRLGMAVVCVFTDADERAGYLSEAEQSFRISSYLAQQELIAVALRAGAQAVHPGIGFLAENFSFAQAVEAVGLLWVGPTPASMQLLAHKDQAKKLAQSINIPVLSSYTVETAVYPLLLKAAAGGGGKGIRRVDNACDLRAAMVSAASEAARAFGDDTLLLEAFLPSARHVEVQILADRHGQILALGERDCSLQRRQQKILEECPAPDITDEMRQQLHQAAVQLAAAAKYTNIGTVEFLYQDRQFYFLEMNTRLQVEHPVTEMVYGVDLVEWQLKIAQGQPLQLDLKPQGHAVEVRLYAEDPLLHHQPCAGKVWHWRAPEQVRVETALVSGQEILPDYDPMLARLIAHAPERNQALAVLQRALEETVLLGVPSNRDFLKYWVAQARKQIFFVTTLEQQPWQKVEDDWLPWAAMAADWLSRPQEAWRNMPGQPYKLTLNNSEFTWPDYPCGLNADGSLWLEISSQRRTFFVHWSEVEVWVASSRQIGRFCLPFKTQAMAMTGNNLAIKAPLTGRIIAILVQPGQKVKAGDLLLRLEAMKMDHRVLSPGDGIVDQILCCCEEVVQAGSLLVQLQ